MSRRPSKTILLITSTELVRADLVGGELSTQRQDRPLDVDDLGLLVEGALRLGGRPGRKVWVLANDVWTQTVDLPATGTRGLQGEELAAALKFETEGLSGLPPLDSALGYVPLAPRAGARPFWVTQLSRAELGDVEAVIAEAGGVLAGISHPAGLPGPLNGAGPGDPWKRTELWPGLRLDVEADAGGLNVVVEPADDETLLLAADEDQHHLLVGPDVDVTADEDRHPIYLSEGGALARWLINWTHAFEVRGAVPCVTPPPRPMSSQLQVAASMILAAIVAALCFADYRGARSQASSVEADLKSLRASGNQATQVKRHQVTLRKEVDDLRAAVDGCREILRAQRERVPRLLAALAEAPEGVVVQAIDDRGREIVIRGLAPSPQLPNELAADLADELSDLDWRVDPPRSLVEREGLDPMWSFELSIRDPHTLRTGSSATPRGPQQPGRIRRTRGRTR